MSCKNETQLYKERKNVVTSKQLARLTNGKEQITIIVKINIKTTPELKAYP
jgi:hypothetical protein